LPAQHPAAFIAGLVDEHLDLVRIRAAYTEGRATLPYDPRLMVRILLYGYTTGVRSSRVIGRECVDDVAFRWLVVGSVPDYLATARLRKPHLSALGRLLVEALALCQTAGMVRLGRGALDRRGWGISRQNARRLRADE
jgi:transposase